MLRSVDATHLEPKLHVFRTHAAKVTLIAACSFSLSAFIAGHGSRCAHCLALECAVQTTHENDYRTSSDDLLIHALR